MNFLRLQLQNNSDLGIENHIYALCFEVLKNLIV